MLSEFLAANSNELIVRCRQKTANRFAPAKTPADVEQGVPLFLQHLAETLRREHLTGCRDDADPEFAPETAGARRVAGLHGSEMLRVGFDIGQVVHSYGDVCQSVTELALEQQAQISVAEFHTFNRCLDNAIADAVTAFGGAHQRSVDDRTKAMQTRLDDFSDEQRRLVGIAVQCYSAIRTGTIGMTGATGNLLRHTLDELHSLADRIAPEVCLP